MVKLAVMSVQFDPPSWVIKISPVPVILAIPQNLVTRSALAEVIAYRQVALAPVAVIVVALEPTPAKSVLFFEAVQFVLAHAALVPSEA